MIKASKDFSWYKMLLMVSIIGFLAFTSDRNGSVNPPAEVKSKLESMFPSATAIMWEMERKDYEAELTVNGNDVEVTFDQFGNVLEIEEEMSYDNFPVKVKQAFEKDKQPAKITKAVKLQVADKTTYSLVALKPGTREHFIFADDGSLLAHKVMAKDKPAKEVAASNYTVPVNGKRWDLPVILTEISGICFVKPKQIACVQDELGSIYIYDLQKNIIISEIEFAGPGDYEGISVVNENAYVLRSDGLLYEILNFQSSNKRINEFKLSLPKQMQNFEGLCFDSKSNRLLLAPRTFETNVLTKKGIYSFDLSTKTFSKTPLFTIDLNDPVFLGKNRVGKNEAFIPSEIAIHPTTSDIYLSDARNKQVLVLSSSGTIKSLHPLNSHMFPKTEGIAITTDGQIYFSNEGKKSKPNILVMSADKLR
jgi:uncharacterized protein YjiK